MKNYKKVLLTVLLLIFVVIMFLIYRKYTLLKNIDYTIEYKDKINYSTNIILNINDLNNSSKIDYSVIKSSNIKQITLSNYNNDKLENKIYKYIVKKGNKEYTYLYNGETYEKVKNISDDFYVNYELLRKKIKHIKSQSKNEYIVTMKAYDAYNLIYNKSVMSSKDINDTIDVKIVMDEENKFIKEISYEIDNLNNSDNTNKSLKYKVKIINQDINNHKTISLPF